MTIPACVRVCESKRPGKPAQALCVSGRGLSFLSRYLYHVNLLPYNVGRGLREPEHPSMLL